VQVRWYFPTLAGPDRPDAGQADTDAATHVLVHRKFAGQIGFIRELPIWTDIFISAKVTGSFAVTRFVKRFPTPISTTDGQDERGFPNHKPGK
jgi:hypothetical protein